MGFFEVTMGQKVNPVGFRTGITEGWSSRWFAPKRLFGELLVEDQKIREYIESRLNGGASTIRLPKAKAAETTAAAATTAASGTEAGDAAKAPAKPAPARPARSANRSMGNYAAISRIEIERTREELRVILHTGRPGVVIGSKGEEINRLTKELEDLTQRKVKIETVDIGNPDLNARLVADGIAEQLKKRAAFRRVMKQKAEAAMNAGALGIKIQIGGRIGGAEIARVEKQIVGSIPLHTLQADISYGLVHCNTPFGVIGIKVWIYRGLYADLEARAAAAGQSGRGGPRRPRRR
jgi:small subunit ribosomal protein S3